MQSFVYSFVEQNVVGFCDEHSSLLSFVLPGRNRGSGWDRSLLGVVVTEATRATVAYDTYNGVEL